MTILFCSDPFDLAQPDSDYAPEAEAAHAAGLSYMLLNIEALTHEGSVARALRRVQAAEAEQQLIYRGWMLRPEQYRQLYEGLREKGYALINTPEMYAHCHHFPEAYELISAHTPRSVWTRETGIEAIEALLEPFGDAPLIVKDYVKSQKHHWAEACFIPSASDRAAVEQVTRRFLELQGDDLNEGLVFREYMRCQPIGTHPKSGMPLTEEYRLFYLDGTRIATIRYWGEASSQYAQADGPPVETFDAVARTIRSRFFSMDVARTIDQGWIIMELGDGQVAGLPEHTDIAAFYQALRTQLAAS